MSGFLLDTNCISEVVRSKPEPRVLEWMQAADESLPYLSVLTLGEIRKGLAWLPQSKRRTHLESWLEVELQARFSGRILPIDAAVTDRWGVLAGAAKRRGISLSAIDGLLAATALQHNLTIVSRNVSDFANTQTTHSQSLGRVTIGQVPQESKTSLRKRYGIASSITGGPLPSPLPRESVSKPASHAVPGCWFGQRKAAASASHPASCV